jgi:hypothetical protein
MNTDARFARIVLMVFSLLASGAAAGEADIAKLAWLAGCWKNETAGPGSGEHWTPLAGGTMFGTSRTIKHGKTVEFEFMELRSLPDGKLAFVAHPSGRHTTTFPLLRIDATEAVFENQQHDFPQRVVYAREGETRLTARIEGMRNGAPRVVEFPMTRVDCETQDLAAAERER